MEALEKKLEGRRETTIGMDTFVSGKLFGQDAVLAVCGPGKVNAAVCTQKMITAFSPDWVLNLGVAGAGADGVHIGDLVVATAAVQHDADTSPLGDPVGMVSKVNLVELPCDEELRARLAALGDDIGAADDVDDVETALDERVQIGVADIAAADEGDLYGLSLIHI